MSSSEPIILYDIPSKDPCKCWSLNPWKTRLALNYKGIYYKTEWTEYPDLKPKYQELNVPVPDPSNPTYTSPAVRLPDGTYIQDSRIIATALESVSPTPTLHLESPYLTRLEALILPIATAMQPIFIPVVPCQLLSPRSAEYFKRTREARFGMSLPEFESCERGGENAYQAAKPHLKEVADMLRENGEGPFFMGKEVSYADFVLVGFLRFMDRIGVLQKVVKGEEEALIGVYDGCKEWLDRDGH